MLDAAAVPIGPENADEDWLTATREVAVQDQSKAPQSETAKPPVYRVMLLDADGRVLSNLPLPPSVESDERAKSTAQSMVDGHAVELWDGLRFIEHFDPKSTPS